MPAGKAPCRYHRTRFGCFLMSRSDLDVECEDCGKTGTRVLPSVDLFGSTVVFTDATDASSMYLLYGDTVVCGDCAGMEVGG